MLTIKLWRLDKFVQVWFWGLHKFDDGVVIECDRAGPEHQNKSAEMIFYKSTEILAELHKPDHQNDDVAEKMNVVVVLVVVVVYSKILSIDTFIMIIGIMVAFMAKNV